MDSQKQIANDSRGSEPLKNRQQEAFCAAATGYDGGDPCTATDAYMKAYPKAKSRNAARANAARLAAQPEVAARCRWMRGQLAEKGVMDAHAVRAKVLRLRLDVIDKTANTKNKHLALAAARDLDRQGYTLVGPGTGESGVPGSTDRVVDAVAVNLRKFLEGDGGDGIDA